MATNAEAITAALEPLIKAAVTSELEARGFNFSTQGRDGIPWLTNFVDALARGIAQGVGDGLYPELCKLQDNTGLPPASAHS